MSIIMVSNLHQDMLRIWHQSRDSTTSTADFLMTEAAKSLVMTSQALTSTLMMIPVTTSPERQLVVQSEHQFQFQLALEFRHAHYVPSLFYPFLLVFQQPMMVIKCS